MSERGEVRYGDRTIAYSITRSSRRRKTIAIVLDPSEGVLVAAPKRTSAREIEGIVRQRAGWIVRRASEPVLRPRRREFVGGEALPYLGRVARLVVEDADARRVSARFAGWTLRVRVPAALAGEGRRAAVERAVVAWYRRRAAELLAARAGRWARWTGWTPRAVLVRDQRRRWGSCASDGTLRFNWRLIMARPRLIDYVIVHEMAHLRVRNHSPAFWSEVAKVMPDYGARRAQLRAIGGELAL